MLAGASIDSTIAGTARLSSFSDEKKREVHSRGLDQFQPVFGFRSGPAKSF